MPQEGENHPFALQTEKLNILLEVNVRHCPLCTILEYQSHLLGGVEVED